MIDEVMTDEATTGGVASATTDAEEVATGSTACPTDSRDGTIATSSALLSRLSFLSNKMRPLESDCAHTKL